MSIQRNILSSGSPGGKRPSGLRHVCARGLAAGVLGAAALSFASARAADFAPASVQGQFAGGPTMNPMARDMLDRMLQAGRAQPDPTKRKAALGDAARGIPRAFYGLILDGVPAPAPGTVEYEAAHAVFLRWAWETPDYAAAWAAASPSGSFRNEALAEAAGRWAGKSTDDAVKWVGTLDSVDRRLVFEKAGPFMIHASAASLDAWQQAARTGR